MVGIERSYNMSDDNDLENRLILSFFVLDYNKNIIVLLKQKNQKKMAEGKFYGIQLLDVESFLANRQNCLKSKSVALEAQMAELQGIINVSAFARRFFGKSQSWFAQRQHHSLVMHKEQSFKAEEYSQIVAGFRELAKQLNQYADELDRAEPDD